MKKLIPICHSLTQAQNFLKIQFLWLKLLQASTHIQVSGLIIHSLAAISFNCVCIAFYVLVKFCELFYFCVNAVSSRWNAYSLFWEQGVCLLSFVLYTRKHSTNERDIPDAYSVLKGLEITGSHSWHWYSTL